MYTCQWRDTGPPGPFVFSSPEPKALGELIVLTVIHRQSKVTLIECLSTFSNNFSSETAGPISIRFHMQHPDSMRIWDLLNGHGHMISMALMPIHGKNLKRLLLQNY